MHYNLVVRLLNDRFGIQVRGGWSCASSLAHYLFKIDSEQSEKMIQDIENQNLTDKPGWVRVSLHHIMTNAEVQSIIEALREIIQYGKEWATDYQYNPKTNEFDNLRQDDTELQEGMKAMFLGLA